LQIQKPTLAYSTVLVTLALLLLTAAFLNLMPWTTGATVAEPEPEMPVSGHPQEPPTIPADRPAPPVEEPEPLLFTGNINRLPLEMIVDKLSFLQSPIAGARILMTNGQLPGAPRAYRNGTHEGIDYYNGFVGTPIRRGTPVLAAADGEVIRIDHNYVEMTTAERGEYRRLSAEAKTTPEYILDKFRGRQVWLSHQGQVITRYAHLDTLEQSLSTGDTVTAGRQIGTVGNSGTGPAIVGSDGEIHLHFEIRLNGHYLGEGLPPDEVRFILRGILE
jgi:murein DD-endopeptidase MepM/ murein hydrolase activator NlpD